MRVPITTIHAIEKAQIKSLREGIEKIGSIQLGKEFEKDKHFVVDKKNEILGHIDGGINIKYKNNAPVSLLINVVFIPIYTYEDLYGKTQSTKLLLNADDVLATGGVSDPERSEERKAQLKAWLISEITDRFGITPNNI